MAGIGCGLPWVSVGYCRLLVRGGVSGQAGRGVNTSKGLTGLEARGALNTDKHARLQSLG